MGRQDRPKRSPPEPGQASTGQPDGTTVPLQAFERVWTKLEALRTDLSDVNTSSAGQKTNKPQWPCRSATPTSP